MDFLKVFFIFILGTQRPQDSLNASQQWWWAQYSIRKSKLQRQLRL